MRPHWAHTTPGTVPGKSEVPRTYKVVAVRTHFTEGISDDVSKVTWLSRARTQSALA